MVGASAVAGVLLASVEAEARSATRSSGGYSKPSSGGSRTPSFSGSSASRPGSGSSGGYSRPDRTPSVAPAPRRDSPSDFDRSVSRQGGYDSLQGYRQDRAPAPAPNAPATPSRTTAPPPSRAATAPPPPRTPSVDPRRSLSDGQRYSYPTPPPGYRPPPYAQGPLAGGGNTLLWWFLLDSLGDAVSAAMLANAVRSDPAGYQQFRADAGQLAAENPELKARLATADSALSAEGVNAVTSAGADQRGPGEGGGLWIVVLILIVGGGIAYMVFIRRRTPTGPGEREARKAGSAAAPAGASRRIRVGMAVPIDPTPFLLGGEALHVEAPAAGPNGQAVATAVGILTAGGAEAQRLYIDDEHFFEAYIGGEGAVAGARWFAQIDEVAPARDEWPVWLDPQEGMLHHHEFQTHDGTLYTRAWGPARGSVPPREFTESVADGSSRPPVSRRHTAMLYRRDTGLDDPAPASEYLLVDVVEDETARTASVHLYTGIDVNPATLGL